MNSGKFGFQKKAAMNLKYAVIGTGAIGGYFGGKLARAGKEVHFLFRSDYKVVKEKGLQINSVNGDFLINPVNAYQSTQDMPVCDVVLVGLKTTANDLLPELLKPILHKNSLVVLIQNGLGVEEKLAEFFPNVGIAGGMAFICSQKNSPGVISHLDYGQLNLGLYQGDAKLLKQVSTDLLEAGVKINVAENLGYARWQKLLWNVPFNGMCVVLNTNTEKLMENEATRELSKNIMFEVIQAARKCGYDLSDELPDKMIKMTMQMKPYAPSMKLDFDNKRPLEIEAIYSAPILAARKAGYEMKKVTMLEQQLIFIGANY